MVLISGSLAARSDTFGIQFPSGGSGGCNPPNSLIWLVDQPATLANRLFSIPDRSTMLTHSLAMLNWLTMLAESQIPDLNWKPSVYKTDALPIVLIWPLYYVLDTGGIGYICCTGAYDLTIG